MALGCLPKRSKESEPELEQSFGPLLNLKLEEQLDRLQDEIGWTDEYQNNAIKFIDSTLKPLNINFKQHPLGDLVTGMGLFSRPLLQVLVDVECPVDVEEIFAREKYADDKIAISSMVEKCRISLLRLEQTGNLTNCFNVGLKSAYELQCFGQIQGSPFRSELSIKFSNALHLQECKLFKLYRSLDVRVDSLSRLLIFWADSLNLFEEAQESYSSQCILLLIIFFLQQKQIVPNFRTLQGLDSESDIQPMNVSWKNVSFCEDTSKIKTNELSILDDKSIRAMSVLGLLQDWFKLFANMDFKKLAICTRSGLNVEKRQHWGKFCVRTIFKGNAECFNAMNSWDIQQFQKQCNIAAESVAGMMTSDKLDLVVFLDKTMELSQVDGSKRKRMRMDLSANPPSTSTSTAAATLASDDALPETSSSSSNTNMLERYSNHVSKAKPEPAVVVVSDGGEDVDEKSKPEAPVPVPDFSQPSPSNNQVLKPEPEPKPEPVVVDLEEAVEEVLVLPKPNDQLPKASTAPAATNQNKNQRFLAPAPMPSRNTNPAPFQFPRPTTPGNGHAVFPIRNNHISMGSNLTRKQKQNRFRFNNQTRSPGPVKIPRSPARLGQTQPGTVLRPRTFQPRQRQQAFQPRGQPMTMAPRNFLATNTSAYPPQPQQNSMFRAGLLPIPQQQQQQQSMNTNFQFRNQIQMPLLQPQPQRFNEPLNNAYRARQPQSYDNLNMNMQGGNLHSRPLLESNNLSYDRRQNNPGSSFPQTLFPHPPNRPQAQQTQQTQAYEYEYKQQQQQRNLNYSNQNQNQYDEYGYDVRPKPLLALPAPTTQPAMNSPNPNSAYRRQGSDSSLEVIYEKRRGDMGFRPVVVPVPSSNPYRGPSTQQHQQQQFHPGMQNQSPASRLSLSPEFSRDVERERGNEFEEREPLGLQSQNPNLMRNYGNNNNHNQPNQRLETFDYGPGRSMPIQPAPLRRPQPMINQNQMPDRFDQNQNRRSDYEQSYGPNHNQIQNQYRQQCQGQGEQYNFNRIRRDPVVEKRDFISAGYLDEESIHSKSEETDDELDIVWELDPKGSSSPPPPPPIRNYKLGKPFPVPGRRDRANSNSSEISLRLPVSNLSSNTEGYQTNQTTDYAPSVSPYGYQTAPSPSPRSQSQSQGIPMAIQGFINYPSSNASYATQNVRRF